MEKEERVNLKTLRLRYLDKANECTVAELYPECHEYFMSFYNTIPIGSEPRKNIAEHWEKIKEERIKFDKETVTKYKEQELKIGVLHTFYWKQGRDKDIVVWYYRELLSFCMQQAISFDLIEKKA